METVPALPPRPPWRGAHRSREPLSGRLGVAIARYREDFRLCTLAAAWALRGDTDPLQPLAEDLDRAEPVSVCLRAPWRRALPGSRPMPHAFQRMGPLALARDSPDVALSESAQRSYAAITRGADERGPIQALAPIARELGARGLSPLWPSVLGALRRAFASDNPAPRPAAHVRSPHEVRPFLRRLRADARPSEAGRRATVAAGVALPPGHTIVRGHRGGHKRAPS